MDFFGKQPKSNISGKVSDDKHTIFMCISTVFLLITTVAVIGIISGAFTPFNNPIIFIYIREIILLLILLFAYILYKISSRRMSKIAYLHPVTNLPNAQSLNNHISNFIKNRQTEAHASLIIFEIDSFEKISLTTIDVNDSYLKAVADMLSNSFPHAGMLSHLEANKFALFFENVYTQSMIEDEIEKLVSIFSKSVNVLNKEFYTTLNIGVAEYPVDATESKQLIDRTFTALYFAKDSTTESYSFYRDYANIFSDDVTLIKEYLPKAIANNEFRIFYQSNIDYKTGTIVSLDALLRWKHPERGNIPPSSFIAIAEETGLIFQIGDWVLRQCCRQHKQWKEIGIKPPKIIVNVSEVQAKSPTFADDFINILTEENISPRSIAISISENYTTQNIDALIVQLNKLRNAQVEVEFDNFGVGLGSVNLLSIIPMDYVKIDRSITSMIGKESFNETLIDMIISLSHAKGLKVIGAGIENKDQLSFLLNRQCDILQGYLISWPFPAEEIDVMLFLKKKLLVTELNELNKN